MSHDETSGPVTRKERRAAYGGKRRAAPRYVFSAAAHIRKDWTTSDLIEFLESRARGYNGLLRELLCTSAQGLREQQAALLAYEESADAAAEETDEVVHEMRVQGDLAEMAAEDGS